MLKSSQHQFDKVCVCVMYLYFISLSLQVLRGSLEIMVHRTKSLMMDSDNDHHSTLHDHNQLLLRQQLEALDRAVSMLQVTCLIYSTGLTGLS